MNLKIGFRDAEKFSLRKLLTTLIVISLFVLTDVQGAISSGTVPAMLYDDIVFVKDGNNVLLQQAITVTGKVVDESTGEPFPAVNVIEDGTTNGTITDAQGRYSITVRGPSSILRFSFVGYASQDITVGSRKVIDVTLAVMATELEELVVVGYGTQKKVSVIGSISAIESAEIIKSPTSSIQNALVGRSTGLISVQRSGAPGEDFADIYIRGQATYGNSDPLILVDGIERDITTLDPNEIQSINILKDASATAVFGVRGANGVIVVTTKTGSLASKPTITFSGNFGFASPVRVPRFLDSWEWADFYNKGLFNDNLKEVTGDGIINQMDVDSLRKTFNPTFTDQDIALYKSGEDPAFHPSTDWYKLLVKENVPQQQFNFNMSGGSDKTKYFVSLGYFHQIGSFAGLQFFDDIPSNADIKRYNIRANTDFQWTKRFSTSVKFSTQISNGLNSNIQAGTSEMLNNVFTNSPLGRTPVLDGVLIQEAPELESYSSGGNPIYLFGKSYDIDYEARTTIDITSNFDLGFITKGLSIRGKFAYDHYYRHQSSRSRSVPSYELVRLTPGYTGEYYALTPMSYDGPFSSSESYGQNYRLYGEGAVEYNRTFDGKHALTGLFLGTLERSYRGGSPALPYNYMGLVARVTYGFDRRYLFEFNMGYNGSENFIKGKQFGFFPSYSLGYVISEESFFPKNNILTFLKIRGSQGKVGNDKISGDRFLYTPSSYNRSNSSYRFGDAYTTAAGRYMEDKIGNPDVTWEVATKSNIGIEMKFLNNKINFTGDLFKERREGILDNYNNIPFTFGDLRLLPSYNLGIVDNHGYEFELGYRSTSNRPLQYWVNANYTFARNKIIYNDEIPPEYDYLRRTGLPIGQPFMLVADGFYNTWEEVNDPERIPTIWDTALPVQPGDVRYIDQNDDGIIDANDQVAVGYSGVPEIVYGANLGLSYKGFDISILLQGTEHVNNLYGNRTIFSAGIGSRTEAAYDAWTQEKYINGDEILYPRLSLKNSGVSFVQGSTLLNQDASYIRLKNLEIGYTLPASLTKRAGCKSLRVFFNGQNLATLSKMIYWDPEAVRNANQQYPVSRIINFGFRANF